MKEVKIISLFFFGMLVTAANFANKMYCLQHKIGTPQLTTHFVPYFVQMHFKTLAGARSQATMHAAGRRGVDHSSQVVLGFPWRRVPFTFRSSHYKT